MLFQSKIQTEEKSVPSIIIEWNRLFTGIASIIMSYTFRRYVIAMAMSKSQKSPHWSVLYSFDFDSFIIEATFRIAVSRHHIHILYSRASFASRPFPSENLARPTLLEHTTSRSKSPHSCPSFMSALITSYCLPYCLFCLPLVSLSSFKSDLPKLLVRYIPSSPNFLLFWKWKAETFQWMWFLTEKLAN